MKIGIPRALSYYAYYPFFRTFFENLGLEVVVSDETTKEIMDMGIQDTITDACVPIKLFHGHVKNLMNRVDYVFVPRLVSVNREATFCPKFLGLPDMVICSIPKFKNMLEVRIDLKKSRFELFKLCIKLAKQFKKGFFRAYIAYSKACNSLKNYASQFLQGGIPPLGIASQKKSSNVSLAVVGYPYILYDPYLSLDLIKKLISMGVYVVTPEMLAKEEKQKQASKLRKNLFWTFSNEVIRTAYSLFENGSVDGIIHVTAFGCGPDFIVDKLMEIDAKKYKMPFLTVTIDEHTGQEGLNTRLEAFVDMIKIKKAKKEAALA
ncbi:activator of (R)-2-hydroxyglutaryl-CoA dehydratase [Tepidanaerobacter sp. GT38]|uniref:acyl-CoA dehydratase activase-related protein n=1 Tax=Tepidanaerobacter sp. GT38 TaxID=2722793 RepID=UPI001F44B5A4|nr:acyl-CoA dehydratase activase-related protein [Tepidanaerobacter sp. GT38]MCG1010985.1 activator of (R)-2-hydroxyglutaryl-CoA dehydratase [Tepidanaerobacter sp. GT38]